MSEGEESGDQLPPMAMAAGANNNEVDEDDGSENYPSDEEGPNANEIGAAPNEPSSISASIRNAIAALAAAPSDASVPLVLRQQQAVPTQAQQIAMALLNQLQPQQIPGIGQPSTALTESLLIQQLLGNSGTASMQSLPILAGVQQQQQVVSTAALPLQQSVLLGQLQQNLSGLIPPSPQVSIVMPSAPPESSLLNQILSQLTAQSSPTHGLLQSLAPAQPATLSPMGASLLQQLLSSTASVPQPPPPALLIRQEEIVQSQLLTSLNHGNIIKTQLIALLIQQQQQQSYGNNIAFSSNLMGMLLSSNNIAPNPVVAAAAAAQGPMQLEGNANGGEQAALARGDAEARRERDSRWTMRYRELVEFQRANGHCRVPQNYQRNKKLSWWVMNQRSQYSRFIRGHACLLTEDRVRLLNEIGFEWRVDRGG